MLKITIQTGATGIIFELAGKLAGLSVQESEGCWRQAVIGDQQVRVMLNAVTFIAVSYTHLTLPTIYSV